MPEGPSIVLLKEETAHFAGKKVLDVSGNTKTIDIDLLRNKKLTEIRSWGKHFLLCFPKFTVRIHFLLFGSYAINQPKDRPERLAFRFTNGHLYFYACSVQLLEGDINDHYDWTSDVMNPDWNPKAARKKIKELPNAMICDILLNQHIFSGVGNIIKNEVLFRVGVHPESKAGRLPTARLTRVINEARIYSFQFLDWKRDYVLKKHWLAHTKKICPKCGGVIIKKHTGKTNRRSFFCKVDQKLFK